MSHRTVTNLLLLVVTSTLLFLACQNDTPPGQDVRGARGVSWPPDTMYVAILGRGQLRFRPAWQLHDPAAAHAPVFYKVVHVFVPRDTTPGEMWTTSPSDTSPSKMVQKILEMPWPDAQADLLLLAKWPPDTTKGEGAPSVR